MWGEVWFELVRLLLEVLGEELLEEVKPLGWTWALWEWVKLSLEVLDWELPSWVAVLQERLD